MLLGTQSFWEGVDLPGDQLRCVIIAKLPFPVPDDPLIQGRSERYDAPFRVVVHKVIGWKLAEHFAGRSRDVELGEDIAAGGSTGIIDDRGDVVTLLEGLPDREREVAVFRIVGGFAPDAIAAQLGISRNNVDQAWHRAKRKLRERLEATT